ncbi:MAG: hypothetical protein JSW23_03850, partial [Planctomycetota bacterium]
MILIMQGSDSNKQQGRKPVGDKQVEAMHEGPEKLRKIFTEEGKVLRVTLLSSPEGRLFVAGAVMGLIFIAWISANFAFSPETAQMLIGLLATQIMF